MVHLQITHLERKSSSIHLHDFSKFHGKLWQLYIFFVCKLLGYVSRAVRPSVSWSYTKRTNPMSWERLTTIRSFQRSAVKGMIVRSIDMRINGDGRKPLSPSNPDRTKRSSSSTDKPLTMSESSSTVGEMGEVGSDMFKKLSIAGAAEVYLHFS